jgi:hypothetical protein
MAEADRKADKGRMDADRKAFIEWMDAKTKATQAETKAILAETKARREKRMEANTNDDRNESTACQDVMEACLEYKEPASGDIKDEQNEMTACNEATEKIEENPEMMQSAEENQDVSSEDVVVGPVKGLKKRCRGRKLTARRRGETKKLNRGNCGSRKKLAAACRKVSRHATVAWLNRKVFRRSGTQENCGQRKELAIGGIRRTQCAELVLRKGRSHKGTSVKEGRIRSGINLQEKHKKEERRSINA